jgi:hypothetical protein
MLMGQQSREKTHPWVSGKKKINPVKGMEGNDQVIFFFLNQRPD